MPYRWDVEYRLLNTPSILDKALSMMLQGKIRREQFSHYTVGILMVLWNVTNVFWGLFCQFLVAQFTQPQKGYKVTSTTANKIKIVYLLD